MIRIFVILILIGSVMLLVGCSNRLTKVEIIDIIDNSNNSQIKRAILFISDSKIAGRDTDELYGWEIKTSLNSPIEINKCIYILIHAEGYHDWEEFICPNNEGIIKVKVNLDPEVIPLPGKET
jgi:hypothetical protein